MPIAANTLALWNLDNALTDSSGNAYTLSQTGTVPFITSPTPAQGTHAAGAFGGAQYLSSAAVRTALSGSTTYTIEGYVYFTSLAATRIFLTAGGAAGDSIVMAALATGAFRLVFDDVRIHDSAAGVFTVNNWYYFAVVVDGTSTKQYVALAGAAPAVVKDDTDAAPAFAGSGNIVLGALSFSLGTLPHSAGYLDAIRISNVARTSLPTVDVSGSLLSPGFMRRRRRG